MDELDRMAALLLWFIAYRMGNVLDHSTYKTLILFFYDLQGTLYRQFGDMA